MAWRAFNWGSRGPYYDAGLGVYVAHVFLPGCIQATLFGENTVSGQQYLHVFHADLLTTPTPADVAFLANLVAAWATARYKSLLTSDVTMRRVVCTSIEAPNGAQWETSINVPGNRSGLQAPGDVTLALKKTGHTAGRRRRGRFFVWPPSVDDYVGDQFTSAYVTAARAAFAQLRDDMDANNQPMVIASFTGGATYPVQDIVAVDDLIDRQGRRLKSHGR